jgi:hypothetical protein
MRGTPTDRRRRRRRSQRTRRSAIARDPTARDSTTDGGTDRGSIASVPASGSIDALSAGCLRLSLAGGPRKWGAKKLSLPITHAQSLAAPGAVARTVALPRSRRPNRRRRSLRRSHAPITRGWSLRDGERLARRPRQRRILPAELAAIPVLDGGRSNHGDRYPPSCPSCAA